MLQNLLVYIGSIAIDSQSIEKVGIRQGEKLLVVDNTNRARLETYVIKGKLGDIYIDGASVYFIQKNGGIIMIDLEFTDQEGISKDSLVDKDNNFVRFL